ncbi:alpha/beta hydrolase [Mangrovihabitans endophyticus]|uniref:Esterase n=1 Tax=Mangrovihabitans endophyticus TaxID=1751298 RepID=A0A8J3BZ02_9ACTN|nr:alpha/beta hydrolase family protein [Mangrovihabitans endophyticus]GGK84817.1 esterase [Mangrovihabitans endophyticus]
MALIRCDFFSAALELSTSMTVLLPQSGEAQIGVSGRAGDDPPPLLYLLHGLTDDDTAWTRYTSIERYAAERGLAVVMPQVHRSFYADQAYGMRFWTFLSEELPAIVQRFFRVSARREDTFVAGLSMGGYGAFKWALRQPERFAAAASLSGALDAAHVQKHDRRPHIQRLAATVWTDDLAGGGDDLMHLVAQADPAVLPRLMLRCGTEDHTLAQNERFVRACREAEVPIDAAFGPGGHEWSYWDAEIRTVLEFMKPRAAPS